MNSLIATLDLAARKAKKFNVEDATVTGSIGLALEESIWILDNEAEEDDASNGAGEER